MLGTSAFSVRTEFLVGTASNPSHDFVLVNPLCCNDDRAGEIGRTFHFMTRHDPVLANDSGRL
jgi:hypothetical protein